MLSLLLNQVISIIINGNEIADSLKIGQEQIMNKIGEWLSQGRGWTVQSAHNHISIFLRDQFRYIEAMSTLLYQIAFAPARRPCWIGLLFKHENSDLDRRDFCNEAKLRRADL